MNVSATHKQPASRRDRNVVLLVGGGTGGHILPLKNLAQHLIKKNAEVHLIVSDAILDKKIIDWNFCDLVRNDKDGLHIHYLKTQKIHYHLSFENLIAPFKIFISIFRAKKLLEKINPDVVFLKGGFVGFPVIMAIKYLVKFRGKLYLHESDISSGALTNFFGKLVDQKFSNFGQNAQPLFYFPMKPTKNNHLMFNSAVSLVPKILIFGGSQGAQFLNHLIFQNLESLTQKYEITLITGFKTKIENSFPKFEDGKNDRFKIYELLPQAELMDVILNSDCIITRSGASIFQIFAAKKKSILIPLPTSARNHQYENAKYFEKMGLCYLLEQNAETSEKLMPLIQKILEDEKLEENLKKVDIREKSQEIAEIVGSNEQ